MNHYFDYAEQYNSTKIFGVFGIILDPLGFTTHLFEPWFYLLNALTNGFGPNTAPNTAPTVANPAVTPIFKSLLKLNKSQIK